MKNIKIVLVILLTTFAFNQALAQGDFARKIKQTTWTFGLGTHFVVDGGKETSFPFDTKAWNYLPFPSRLTLDGYFQKGWSFQAEFAYTQYKVGTILDQVATTKVGSYFGADFNAKFAFSHWAKHEGWFDPYVTVGYGFTNRSLAVNKNTGNNNIGLGCNFHIYKGFGLNLQGLGKFVMKGGQKSNYTHYSVTLFYKLLSKKRNLGDK
jgi:OOP family OmpA-OmpF porin